jgi:tellurite resistance protein TerC
MRGAMIITGTALIQRFEWITYILGGFLIVTGLKMAFQGESEYHPEKNILIRLVSKFLPVTREYVGQAFIVRRNRRLMATPLLLVLLVVDTADIVFAVDSIPAIFAVTTDTFIVYTSNIFAILGLRSLYFILAGAMDRFRYLGPSLAAVLMYVGVKMLVQDWIKLNVFVSLGIIIGILGIGIVASFIAAQRDRVRTPRASGRTHDS